MAPEERRGETLAGLFLLACIGLIVPVLGAFAAVVALLVLVSGVRLERRTAA